MTLEVIALEVSHLFADHENLTSCLNFLKLFYLGQSTRKVVMMNGALTFAIFFREKEMPTLAHSVFGSVARREVDALKSLIISESERTAALGRRIRKARIKAFTSSNPPQQCRPEQSVSFL